MPAFAGVAGAGLQLCAPAVLAAPWPHAAAATSRPAMHHQRRDSANGARCRVNTQTCRAVAFEKDVLEEIGQFSEDGADYYAILGIAPNAGDREIKQAYYAAMRQCHPDLMGAGDESSAHDLSIILNDIYATLSDPDKRATYDAIVGFSEEGVNPFADGSAATDRVFVDECTCIGCINCANVCPATFEIEESFGRARAMRQGADPEPDLQEAIDTCPVNCIHRVSPAQLTLLEAAMQTIERVDAWLLATGGGNSINVFHEAALMWEKRCARIRARIAGEHGWAPWATGPAADAAMFRRRAAGRSSTSEFNKTAVAAANAARRWRDYQRTRKDKAVAGLLE